MTVTDFIAKWRQAELRERAGSQEHFIDLCRLVGHPTPGEADPLGEWFTFERGASKATGGQGWADVWKREFFGWEYKGRHANLDLAYKQLLLYQGALENPPLLVTCDMDRILIHTHFPNTPTETHELTLEGLSDEEQIAKLRAIFHGPDRLRPERTIQRITEEAAELVTYVAQGLRERNVAPQSVARFLDRIVFCLFAEDVGLLPERLLTRLVSNTLQQPDKFRELLGELFAAMATGGHFGADLIQHFNGDLFTDAEVLELSRDEIALLHSVTSMDWSAIDPSIFGTLFERALDPDKRAQLGAHYTSREDIETLVEPVVMTPLRREWLALKADVEPMLEASPSKRDYDRARGRLRTFLERLQHVTILDPACGSGNFLYVALQKLKDLEKEAIVFSARYFPGFFPQVGPWQLFGIEVSPYAFELAQMTVWIGYLQWVQANGFGQPVEPILRRLDTFRLQDAIMSGADDSISEPEWPPTEFIVGNPPFLGSQLMRGHLGDHYVEALRRLYKGRVPGSADLVCHWFEKARAQVESGKCSRVGLLATQAIRGGANRHVLNSIKDSGDVFFAISDREWALEGAMVHVSMVGFDAGAEQERVLDGKVVASINPDLSEGINITVAVRLAPNLGISFQGPVKVGSFDIPFELAVEMLRSANPHGQPNSDVVRPWVNGRAITERSAHKFIIDFAERPSDESALYELPFEHVRAEVKPSRDQNKRERRKRLWWQHGETVPGWRLASKDLSRYIAIPRVGKHLMCAWVPAVTLPDSAVVVMARESDDWFGLLHSRVHEVWAREQGTQLREAESGSRYTPRSSFETFPLPELTAERRGALAEAARHLDTLRRGWLQPPEWVAEEVTTFRARIDGPWARVVSNPDEHGIGTARYSRAIPTDDDAAAELRKRTLTNLYNDPPTWLEDAHAAIDRIVFEAYGLSVDATDQQILATLLDKNLGSRTGGSQGRPLFRAP